MRATVIMMFVILSTTFGVSGCTSSRFSWRKTAAPAVAQGETSTSADSEDKSKPEKSKPEKPKADSTVAAKSNDEKVAATEKPQAEEKPPVKKVESPSATVAEKAQSDVPSDTGNVVVAAAEDNPFQPSRSESTSAARPKADETTPGGFGSQGPGELNRELLILINRELADASPEERSEWFSNLKHVDPAVVPDILRARRLTLQMAAQPAPPGGALAGPAANRPASLMIPATASTPSPPAASLGWGNPWETSSTSPKQDPFDVVPASHAAIPGTPGVVRADYSADPLTPGRVEHAVHRLPTDAGRAPIVLQNHEVPVVEHSGYVPVHAGSTVNSASMGNEMPRTEPQVTGPAGIPWPPARKEPAAPNGLSAVTSQLGLGSNLVQNVVGLVPGRSMSDSSVANAGVIQATAEQTVAEPFEQQLAQTIAYVESDVAGLSPNGGPAEQANYIRQHVTLRMLYMLANQQERALTAIPGIPPAEQEFWQQLIWGMVNALDHEHMPNARDRATQTISQLNSAVRRLQEQADLQIRHVAFCHQILYFGNFEKLPRNEFSPGQEALLYAELDNFKSDPTADGQYRTLLRSSIEILSPTGELRKQIDFPATEDLCNTYRRDYFHNYQFRIPERMPLGPHVLKLTVFDELSGKLTSYSMNFMVK